MAFFKKRYFPILFLFIGIFVGVNATAQVDDVKKHKYTRLVQKKHKTNVVYPRKTGEIGLSTSPEFIDGKSTNEFELPFSIEYGITDSWLVELEWYAFKHLNPDSGSSTNGIGDLELSTKYSLMNLADSTFHFAFGLEISFPVGNVNKQLSSGFIEYEPYFIVAKDFPKLGKLHLYTQVAVEFVQRVRHHADRSNDSPVIYDLYVSTGFLIPVGKFTLSAEYSLTNDEWNNNGTVNKMYFTPEITLGLSKNWEVSLSAPIGLTKDAANFIITGSVVYFFNVFKRE